MNIGKGLKLGRTGAELNQGQAAEQLGVTRTHLSFLENNRGTPSMKFLRKAAELYGVTISFILQE